MLYYGTDPEFCIAEHTLIYENEIPIALAEGRTIVMILGFIHVAAIIVLSLLFLLVDFPLDWQVSPPPNSQTPTRWQCLASSDV